MKGFLAGLGLFFAFIIGMAVYTGKADATCSNCGTLTYQNGISKGVFMDANNNTVNSVAVTTLSQTPTFTPNGSGTYTATATNTPGQNVNVTPTGTLTPANVISGTIASTCVAGANTPCPTVDIPANTVHVLSILACVGPTPCSTVVVLPQLSADGISWGTIGSGVLDISGTLSGGAIKSIVRTEGSYNGICNSPVVVHLRLVPTITTLGGATAYGWTTYYQSQ